MRNAALILALIGSGQLSARAQDGSTESKSGTITVKVADDQIHIFKIVEEMPSYAGGYEAQSKFLRKNIKYPVRAMEEGISGWVYITFVVDEIGTPTDIKVRKGIGGGCDEEALRVVKLMPRWNPGAQKGEPVKVQLTLPIEFKLM